MVLLKYVLIIRDIQSSSVGPICIPRFASSDRLWTSYPPYIVQLLFVKHSPFRSFKVLFCFSCSSLHRNFKGNEKRPDTSPQSEHHPSITGSSCKVPSFLYSTVTSATYCWHQLLFDLTSTPLLSTSPLDEVTG